MTLLRKENPKMKAVPLPKPAFEKLIQYLKSIKKPLPDGLESYLEKVMTASLCLGTHVIHLEGAAIDKAYFISRGFMIAFYIDENGDEQVLDIFFAGEIVAGNSFMNGKPAKYNLRIFKDAFVLEITHAQMEAGYASIEGMDELARLTLASFEDKKVEWNNAKKKGGEELVYFLYKNNLDLLPPGNIIKDSNLASHLGMSVDTLHRYRSSLIKKGLLPGKKR